MHQQFLNMRRFSMIHPAFNARKKPLIPTDSALAGFIEMFDEKHKETATALVEKAESLLAYERQILASERQIQQNFRESMAKAQQSLCEQWEMTHKLSNQIIEMSRERLAQSNAEILRLTSQLTPQGAFKYYEEVHLTGINGRTQKERWSTYLEHNTYVVKQLKKDIQDNVDLPKLADQTHKILSEMIYDYESEFEVIIPHPLPHNIGTFLFNMMEHLPVKVRYENSEGICFPYSLSKKRRVFQ